MATNSEMEEVFMAQDGQGFADAHSAEDWNNRLGFKGKEGGAVKVKREGNEKAIEAILEEINEAHEKAVAASLVEMAKIREEKKALKAAKIANRKGEKVSIGGDDSALQAALAENEKLKAKLAALEAKAKPAAEEPAAEEPAAEEPGEEEPAPKKAPAKKKGK